MQPDPVPTSTIRLGFRRACSRDLGPISSRTVSTTCSVSGRGIKTAGLTIKSIPQNSWCPVMNWAGTPRERSAKTDSYRDLSSLLSFRSGCANRYARSQLRVNMSRSSAFIRGDGTLLVESWDMPLLSASLSCTLLFHHGKHGTEIELDRVGRPLRSLATDGPRQSFAQDFI